MTPASFVWIVVFCAGVPAVAGVLSTSPQLRRPALAAMVFWTCHIKKPFYMEVFFERYRGVDRGFGVTISDLLFFGLALFLILGGDRKKRVWWPGGTTLWLLLIFACALSLVTSSVPYYGLFSLHKLCRGFVLFWVIANVVHDRRDLRWIVGAGVAALLFQGAIVIWAKYITKSVVNRSVGSFPHPNSLAMYVDLIMPMLLALMLAGTLKRSADLWMALAILSGVICVIFGKSRAALAIMCMALGSTAAVSLVLRPTVRKAGVILLGAMVLSVVGAAAAPKLIARFQKAPKASAETREYFNDAAHAMANEHTFGTGLNSYSWMLANTDYYWIVYADKVDVPDPEAFRASKSGLSRLGTCHHIFLLYAAETGWFGAVIYALFCVRLYLPMLRFLVIKDPEYRAVLLGLAVGLGTLHLQGLLEWVFRQTQVFYLFCIVSGLGVAVPRLARSSSQC